MSKLRNHVEKWIKEEARDGYDGDKEAVIKDLMRGGCQSGMVGHLIYYTDTVKFYKKYQVEISALLYEILESSGCSIAEMFGEKWDAEDPLALDTMNQNLLAWFGFEETASQIQNELEEN